MHITVGLGMFGMEESSVSLVIESFGIPVWLVWFNRLRCCRVSRTVKFLRPIKCIFLKVQCVTWELMRQSNLLKTGGSSWNLHSDAISALTKFITCKHNDEYVEWKEGRYWAVGGGFTLDYK